MVTKDMNSKTNKKQNVSAKSTSSKGDMVVKNYDNEPNNLSVDDLYSFTDLYFNRTGIMYSHLYNSFNKFLDETVKNILETGEHKFLEKVTKTKIIKYYFKFSNIAIRPCLMPDGDELMFPSDARTKNLTYGAKILATVTQIQEIKNIATDEVTINIVGEPENEIPIVNSLPIMLKSKFCSLNIKKGFNNEECDYDPGGYFILKGSEKVVIPQERICDNKPLVFMKKESGQDFYAVQTHSKSPKIYNVQIVSIKMRKDGTMMLKVPILSEVPVFIVMRALGIESSRDIINYTTYDENNISMNDVIKKSLDNAVDNNGVKIQTQEAAIEYLITKIKVVKKYSETDKAVKHQQRRTHLMSLLQNNFLPHVEGGLLHKAYYLGYMINHLVNCYIGVTPIDDRDSCVNKRIESINELFEALFRQSIRQVMNECNKHFKRKNTNDEKPLNIINQIKPNVIEQAYKNALMTGSWGRSKGVAQMIMRTTYLLMLTMLRRFDTPSVDASTNKLTGPRHVDPRSAGNVCVIETPEHANVGLNKHLTMLGSLTVTSDSQFDILKKIIKPKLIDVQIIPPNQLKKYTKVFLNGEWLGMSDEPIILYKKLRDAKLSGDIDPIVGIVNNIRKKQINVYCDCGRLFRPVLKVNDKNELYLTKNIINKISLNKMNNTTHLIDWDELMIKYPDIIEYIDIEEQQYALIAPEIKNLEEARDKLIGSVDKVKNVVDNNIINRYDDMQYVRYSHCEIHPSFLIGIITANLALCNHDPGIRNIYHYSQGRQAMGIYASNYKNRLDISYVLYHPQKPLVASRTAKYINSDILTSGENVVVVVGCFTGYNQEDSLIMNKSSVEHGIFRSMSLKKIISEIKKNQSTSQDDTFTRPEKEKTQGMKLGNYNKLNDKGYVPEETVINDNDAIIGKVTPIQVIDDNNPKNQKDSSEMYRHIRPGVIDKVFLNIYNVEGYEMRKVRVRSERTPETGDKFCCYTPDHDVLTMDGWIPINKLTMEHRVATLIDGDSMQYTKPHMLQKYDYEGNMYCVNSDQINLKVTPNHRMYTGDKNGKYCINKAEELYGEQRHYKKNIDGRVLFQDDDRPNELKFDIHNNVTHFVLPKHDKSPSIEIDIDAWLTMFGIWISKGCVSDERFYNYYKQLSVNSVKSLPNWVWYLSMKQSQMLIRCMMLGDEHITVDGMQQYKTSSIQLANDFQRLCLHSGYSTNIVVKYKDEIVKSTIDAYHMTIINKQNTPLINENIKPNGDERSDKWTHYEGKVYCCSVQGDGIIYVRREGITSWCGNSRHSQKGTIGYLAKQSDMPFTAEGISPDIILNPNAIPSRMTMGHIIESLIGKVGALRGTEIDGTPFIERDLESVKDELASFGYERTGVETMYNGMTGEKMKVKFYIGPTYYQRLKHLVSDKIHSRARGPRTLLTRQPPEGRSRDGGLRIGEMERDAIGAHGMSLYLKEKLMDTSDAYSTYVCDECGLFAQRMIRRGNTEKSSRNDIYWCPACKNKTKISKVMIPYAFKLMLQELTSVCIAPRIRTDA